MDSPTLLCIDDRPQMLKLRKITLESQGDCVKLASSGYTAIKTLEETSVAAVLLEYKQACRSSCSPLTPRCHSESCGWWMIT